MVFDDVYQVCGFLGGLMFPIATGIQTLKAVRTRSTEDISYGWWGHVAHLAYHVSVQFQKSSTDVSLYRFDTGDTEKQFIVLLQSPGTHVTRISGSRIAIRAVLWNWTEEWKHMTAIVIWPCWFQLLCPALASSLNLPTDPVLFNYEFFFNLHAYAYSNKPFKQPRSCAFRWNVHVGQCHHKMMTSPPNLISKFRPLCPRRAAFIYLATQKSIKWPVSKSPLVL